MKFLEQNAIKIESYNPIQLKVKSHTRTDERIIHEENLRKKKTGNKGIKNTKERVSNIEDIMTRSNMNLIKIPNVKEKENRIETTVENTVTENFPKLMTDIKSQI